MIPKLNDEAFNTFLEEFGRNLAKLRKLKNLTQADLARICKSDTAAVSRVERGVFNIKISSLLLLAKGLEVPVEKLFDFDDLTKCIDNILNE